jgi:hypothetical protein
MERRTPFYETSRGRPPACDTDEWTLIDHPDGLREVEHRWRRPHADGFMLTAAGSRRCSLEAFFRDENSDTAKKRLRHLLERIAREAAS